MEAQPLIPVHWVDAAFEASWRAPSGDDDSDGDGYLRECSDAIDAADPDRLIEQVKDILHKVNTRPCSSEAWAFYREYGVRAVEDTWAHPLFVWGGAGGRVDLDWALYEALNPQQRARACHLAHLALTNAACDLPDLVV